MALTDALFGSKLPIKVILVWCLVVFVCYSFFSQPDIVPAVHIPHSRLVDAVVFIAMGAMADDPMVDYSIASVRLLGRWKGDIYILTDAENCFTDAVKEHGVITIPVPRLNSIIEIKTLKPKLMGYLPEKVTGALYIDVDILVTKDLASFFRDLGSMVYTRQVEINSQKQQQQAQPQHSIVASEGSAVTSDTSSSSISSSSSTSNTGSSYSAQSGGSGSGSTAVATTAFEIDPPFDYGAFLDAKGHYVGFCSGCEKWHSGVMWFRRSKGTDCLKAWESLLVSGKYTTDQAALDKIDEDGVCPDALSFPTRHLLFAKDYIGMLFTSGQTFVHLTAAGRPESQDWFYRSLVVPRWRSSLHPPLNPAKLTARKVCTPTVTASLASTATTTSTASTSAAVATAPAQ